MVASSEKGTLPRTLSLSSTMQAPRVPMRFSSISPNFVFSVGFRSFFWVIVVGGVLVLMGCVVGVVGGCAGLLVNDGEGPSGFLMMTGLRIELDVSLAASSRRACSEVILLRSALWISFLVNSSSSFPSGARVT